MSRSKTSPLWLLLLLALLGIGSSASADDTPDNDDDDDDDDGATCPEGQRPNPARRKAYAEATAKGLRGAARLEAIADIPKCVPIPVGPPKPEHICPVGEHWDDAAGKCVSDIVKPQIGCGPGQHWDAELGACVPDEVPPIEGPDPALDDPTIFNDYPTPGTFYQVKAGNYELGVAKLYAASCLFLAARAQGMSDDEANAWASAHNTSAVRYAAVRFFTCRPQNDMRLGTYRFKPCTGAQHDGGCTHPGANGRGIRFLKTGGDSEARARAGMPWRRGPVLGNPGDSPSASTAIPSGEREYPLLWLGEPDYDALFESNGTVWQPSKVTWAGGASRADMPPRFAALGFEGVPNGVEWGC